MNPDVFERDGEGRLVATRDVPAELPCDVQNLHHPIFCWLIAAAWSDNGNGTFRVTFRPSNVITYGSNNC